MACYTELVVLEDNEINREARKKLGLPLEGGLDSYNAGRVRVEAGIIKTTKAIRRLNPTAVIRRDGDSLSVSVNL